MPFGGKYNRFSKELLNNPELLKKAKSEVESKLIGLKDVLEGIWVLQSQLSSLKFFYEAFMNRGKGANNLERTKFKGHALDQMQNRGILSPSVVLATIKNPLKTMAVKKGATIFYADKLKVVVNEFGDIVTVITQ